MVTEVIVPALVVLPAFTSLISDGPIVSSGAAVVSVCVTETLVVPVPPFTVMCTRQQ